MFWLFLEFLHSSRYQPLYYLTVIVYILDVLIILGIFTLLSFIQSNIRLQSEGGNRKKNNQQVHVAQQRFGLFKMQAINSQKKG